MALLPSEHEEEYGNFVVNINTNKVAITRQTSWKNGHHVHIDIEIGVVTEITSATTVSLLKIPVGYRPKEDIYGFCSLKKANTEIIYRFNALADTSGNIFQNIASTLSPDTPATILTFSFDYLI